MRWRSCLFACLLVFHFFFTASFSKNQSREMFYKYFGLLDKVTDFWKNPQKGTQHVKKFGHFIESNNRSPILKVNEWMQWHQHKWSWYMDGSCPTRPLLKHSKPDQFDGFQAVVVWGACRGPGRFGGWSMKIQLQSLVGILYPPFFHTVWRVMTSKTWWWLKL